MPFTQLTNVADSDALLGHIRTFLASTLTGWTLHLDLATPTDGPSAGGRDLVASKGSILVGLRSCTSVNSGGRLLLFDGIPAYTGGQIPDNLSGNSGTPLATGAYDSASVPACKHINGAPGPYPNVYLFGANSPQSYVHVVVEISAGVYRQVAFGEMSKHGTWTGGEYYSASFHSLGASAIDEPDDVFHRYLFDGNSLSQSTNGPTVRCVTASSPVANWLSLSGNGNAVRSSIQTRPGLFGAVRGGWGTQMLRVRQSSFSGIVPLVPISVAFLEISSTPDVMHFLGTIPDVRSVNIETLSPGQTLTIGGDTWWIFPCTRKNGAATTQNSGAQGLAFKQV